jgi:hypothetical protein
MKLVNAVALLVLAACAVVAFEVLSSPEPAPPKSHRDLGSDTDEIRKLAAEAVAYRRGSNDAPPTAHPSPIDPFATSRVGDWRASHITNDGTLQRDAKTGAIRTHAVHAVTAVTDATVSIAVRGMIDGETEVHDSATQAVPRRGATFEQLLASDWPIPELAIADDTYTIGGRAFRCKKVTYRSTDRMFPRKTITTELWLSPDVPADGVVAKREVQLLDDLRFTFDEELVGFGTGSAATWGERPRGL